MAKTIHLLYSCDNWKMRDSMHLVLATTSKDKMERQIEREIRDGHMDFYAEKWLTGKEGVAAFRKRCRDIDVSDSLGCGFVTYACDGKPI